MRVGVSGENELRKAWVSVVWEKIRMWISEEQNASLKPLQREGEEEMASDNISGVGRNLKCLWFPSAAMKKRTKASLLIILLLRFFHPFPSCLPLLFLSAGLWKRNPAIPALNIMTFAQDWLGSENYLISNVDIYHQVLNIK